MAALEFPIYMKRSFDTQEGSCHLGERLSQLLCLEMKKMKSQLITSFGSIKGHSEEDGDHLSKLCIRRRIRLLWQKDLREANGSLLDNNIPCCGQMTEGTS